MDENAKVEEQQNDSQPLEQEQEVQAESNEQEQEQPLQEESQVATPTEEEAEEPEQEPVEELSPRQQKRVEQVEEQAKEYKLNKILDRIQQSKKPAPKKEEVLPSQGMDYRQEIDAPEDVYERLEQDRQQYAESIRTQAQSDFQAQVASSQWQTNIRIDLPLVKEKLDMLDPQDAQAIDREYLYYSGYDETTGTVTNPNISYADFVEARIEQAQNLARRMNIKSQENIAKQASHTGIRPSGSTGRGSTKVDSPMDIANMTPEQVEKNSKAIDAKINSILGIK